MGFEQMTPVQASTIPLFMQHKDVVVEVRSHTRAAEKHELIFLRIHAGCYGVRKDARLCDPCVGEDLAPGEGAGQARDWSHHRLAYAVRSFHLSAAGDWANASLAANWLRRSTPSLPTLSPLSPRRPPPPSSLLLSSSSAATPSQATSPRSTRLEPISSSVRLDDWRSSC